MHNDRNSTRAPQPSKMSLSSYLAARYLTAEPSAAAGKKRKRKDKKAAASGLIIADDDALEWKHCSSKPEADETEMPLTIISGSAEFRKAKTSTWKSVGGLAAAPPRDSETDAADQIIAQTAAENSAAQQQDAEPVVLDPGIIKMGDGTHAGLQSASAIAEQFEQRQREERALWQAEEKDGKHNKSEDTVYRDATGRRIDLTMRRQEALREANAKAAREREKLEAQKGDFQRAAKEKRKEVLDEARFMPLARTIDDEDLNKELKQRERWNDPASQFMTHKKGQNASGKPLYTGPAVPNRYGIRPGHKWDGVDRGNGWEGHRFKALNRAARNKDLGYSWQMDE